MAKTQWTLLFSTFIISCISLAFIIVSFVTNNWIIAEAHVTGSVSNSKINYGLFGGILTRHILATGTQYDLTIICLYEDNACIYSCQRTPELRAEELKNITKGVNIRECGITTKSTDDWWWSSSVTTNMGNTSIDGSAIDIRQQNNTPATNDQYIEPAVWLSTIIFLGITTFFAFTSALFAVVNIVFSPIEPILSILGLYIWNGITMCTSLIVLLLWGTLYGIVLKDNIIITDTLRIEYPSVSSDLANLGYSYWFVCISSVLHLMNIGLLLWRTHIINLEPQTTTITIEKNDTTLMLY